MVNENYAIKSFGHRACFHRAKDGHTSLPGPWIEKQ